MKPFQKVIAALLAVMLIASAAGCVPVSLSKQWSYDYNDDVLAEKLDIGVYVYALYQAYSTAQGYAQKSKDYKENEPFMDIEIKDDDGNKAKASEWIKTEAEKIAVNTIAIDYLVNKYEATWDEAQMDSAKSTAKSSWEMGPYASYGYYQPMSKELEKYGVSYESFEKSSYVASVKQSAIFDALYGEDGEQEVTDAQLNEYFTGKYVDYSYIPVKLYTSKSDSEGNSTSTAFSKKKMDKTIAALENMANSLNAGSLTFDKAVKTCTKDYNVADSEVIKDTVEPFETTKSNNKDVAKAVKSLDNGKAKVITVGKDSDSGMAYLVLKNDINDDVKDYAKKGAKNRTSVLQNMKSDDFTKFIEDKTAELIKSDALKVNTGVINSYDPNMFFVKTDATEAEKSDETEAE